MEKNNPFKILENEILNSVEFVMDYHQLRFNNNTLNINDNFEIIVNGKKYNKSSSNFCNLVIQCIGRKVITTNIIIDDSINIFFENNYQIHISINPKDCKLPDTVEFIVDQQDNYHWWVW